MHAFHALLLFLAVRFGSLTAGCHSVEHEAPDAVQQFSVRYPTSELMAAKSAA
jgi:hypothetical protein